MISNAQKAEINQHILILRAVLDGKTIQAWNVNFREWYDIHLPIDFVFGQHGIEYRVKPEPREFWLNPATGMYHDDPTDMNILGSEQGNLIHVREVL